MSRLVLELNDEDASEVQRLVERLVRQREYKEKRSLPILSLDDIGSCMDEQHNMFLVPGIAAINKEKLTELWKHKISLNPPINGVTIPNEEYVEYREWKESVKGK